MSDTPTKENIREAIGGIQLHAIDNVLKKLKKISVMPSKCYGDKPETIGALKDNIREAIGAIQLHTIDNGPNV